VYLKPSLHLGKFANITIGRPCCTLNAIHHPAKVRTKKSQDANGLEPTIRLAGAKVMLRSNLWVSAGFTNGSLGTVVGFLYPPVSPDTS
jgi:hypothetical protein